MFEKVICQCFKGNIHSKVLTFPNDATIPPSAQIRALTSMLVNPQIPCSSKQLGSPTRTSFLLKSVELGLHSHCRPLLVSVCVCMCEPGVVGPSIGAITSLSIYPPRRWTVQAEGCAMSNCRAHMTSTQVWIGNKKKIWFCVVQVESEKWNMGHGYGSSFPAPAEWT